MKAQIIFHDQLGLNFETVPPCPSLEPPRRRNRRLGFFGRLFRRRLSHRPPRSSGGRDYEPGSLVRYNPVLE